MRFSLIFALFVFSLAVVASKHEQPLPAQVKNNLFFGRSGSMLLRPATEPMTKELLMVINKDVPAESIDADQFSALVSHHMGTFNTEATQAVDFGNVDIWSRPRSNVLFAFDGVSKDFAEQLPLSQRGDKVTIEMDAYPYNTLSGLTTLLTGDYPNQHGITSRKWVSRTGQVVEAFQDADALPAVGNFVDMNAQTLDEPLLVSFSHSKQLATAGGVHPAFHVSSSEHSYFWDQNQERISSVYFPEELSRLTLSKSELIDSARVAHPDFINNLDMNEAADLSVVVETGFISSLLESLKVEDLVQDSTPDTFIFSLESPKLMAERYGVDSSNYKKTVDFLDMFVRDAITRLDGLYDDRTLNEIVYLAFDDSMPVDGDVLVALNDAVELAEDFLPYIYANYDSSAICDRITSILAEKGVESLCLPNETPLISRAMTVAIDSNNTYNNNTFGNFTANQVAGYQMILWSSVLVVVAAVLATLVVCSVDIPDDSILIRQTPNLFKDNLDLHTL